MILKQCSAAVILLSLMTQILSGPFVVLDYYMNTAAYAANCINKSRPELHCNGQCQMANELKQQEEREHQSPAGEPDYKFPLFVFSKSWFTSAPVLGETSSKNQFAVHQDKRTKDMSIPFFHPPSL